MAVRGHKTGRIGTHQCCYGGTWYVMLEEQEMKQKLGTTVISLKRSFHNEYYLQEYFKSDHILLKSVFDQKVIEKHR